MTVMTKLAAAAAASIVLAGAAVAQSLPTNGALVVVPAYGEVKHANDQAVVTLAIEETDKDKSAAASRVNLKMKQGAEIVKKADPQASLKTQGYYTYAVYPDEVPVPNGRPPKPRVPTAWLSGCRCGRFGMAAHAPANMALACTAFISDWTSVVAFFMSVP